MSDREWKEAGELPLMFLVTHKKNRDPAIRPLKRLAKEDQEFEVSQGYKARPCLSKQTETERLRVWLNGSALAYQNKTLGLNPSTVERQGG